MSDDFMELGDSGLVPIGNGWLLEKSTGNRISPEGRVFDRLGEVLFVLPNHEDDKDDETDRQ